MNKDLSNLYDKWQQIRNKWLVIKFLFELKQCGYLLLGVGILYHLGILYSI